MTPAETGAIPFTAWEQAVFVALFVVLVGSLLYWVERQSSNWRKDMSERDERWQNFTSERDAQRQEFTRERDEQWQKWLDKADTRTAAQLKALTEVIEKLTENFTDHDKTTSDAIATMKERTANKRGAKAEAKA